jgi:cytidylate kinase
MHLVYIYLIALIHTFIQRVSQKQTVMISANVKKLSRKNQQNNDSLENYYHDYYNM